MFEFFKKISFRETIVVSWFDLVSFCETKWFQAQIWPSLVVFFCDLVSSPKNSFFCLNSPLCWVSSKRKPVPNSLEKESWSNRFRFTLEEKFYYCLQFFKNYRELGKKDVFRSTPVQGKVLRGNSPVFFLVDGFSETGTKNAGIHVFLEIRTWEPVVVFIETAPWAKFLAMNTTCILIIEQIKHPNPQYRHLRIIDQHCSTL